MAIRVMEFSNGGYKIRKKFAWKSTYLLKENDWILRIGVVGKCQKVPKFDFQSQFKNHPILSHFFFIKEYQFRSIFIVIDIFW